MNTGLWEFLVVVELLVVVLKYFCGKRIVLELFWDLIFILLVCVLDLVNGGVITGISKELSDNGIEGLESDDRIIIVSSNKGDDLILLVDAIFEIFYFCNCSGFIVV